MGSIRQVLSGIWRAWKRVGQFIGEIIGRVFLMVFYATIVLPFGLGVRLFADPLDTRREKPPAWRARGSPDPTLESAYHQF